MERSKFMKVTRMWNEKTSQNEGGEIGAMQSEPYNNILKEERGKRE